MRGGATGVAVERAQLLEHVACVVLGLEDLRAAGSSDRSKPLELSGRPRWAPPLHEAEELGRRQVGPVAHVREEVAHGDDRRARVAHVLVDHLHVVVAAAREVRDQLLVGERVRVDRLQLLVGRDRGRLEGLVPLA